MGKIEDFLMGHLKDGIDLFQLENGEIARRDFARGNIMKLESDIKLQALKEILLSRYKSYYNMLIDSGDADELFPVLKELREKEDMNCKTNFLFITINPRPPYNIETFKLFFKICMKVFTKPWYKRYCAVLEQRGEDRESLGNGFHLHMLIDKGDYRISHVRREFVSSFNRICDTSNISCFNIAFCKECDILKRQNYMVGEKADSSKHLKQSMDKIWRDIYDIKEYYGELF